MKVNKLNVRKLNLAGMLIAVGVVCSPLNLPIGVAKCFPVQHIINVIAGVFLGPFYALGMAFSASLIRNILGTGSILAFPGSMCGAFLCGYMYKIFRKLPLAYLGELIGTGIFGSILAFPLASFILGNKEVALFTFILPFGISTLVGTIIAIPIVSVLKRIKFVDEFLNNEMIV